MRHLERMHEQHAIDRGIGERQLELVDQRGETGPVGRPFHHPLHRRHEGQAALRLLAKQPEIGRRIADPEHAHAAGIGKALADAAADEAPRHDAEALGIEIAQIDDVDGHGAKGSMESRLASSGSFAAPPYLRRRMIPPRPTNFRQRCLTIHALPGRSTDMPAQTHLFPCLQDNYGVLLHDPESGATAAIDAPEAGAGRGRAEGDRLAAHRHPRHPSPRRSHRRHRRAQGSAIAAASSRPTARRRASRWSTRPCARTTRCASAALEARVIETPGHTAGHISYVFPADKLAFVGDTLFSIGCGRVIEGTPEMMWQSLLKLRGLPDDTRIYCGHEYTMANIRFAQDDRARQRGAQRARAGGREAPRRAQADRSHRPSARRRRRTRSCARTCPRWRSRSGSRASRRGRCSRKSASARTGLEAAARPE